MKYIDFDPKKHKGYPLYELQSYRDNGSMVTVIIPAQVTFDEASQTPWHYLVRDEKETNVR